MAVTQLRCEPRALALYENAPSRAHKKEARPSSSATSQTSSTAARSATSWHARQLATERLQLDKFLDEELLTVLPRMPKRQRERRGRVGLRSGGLGRTSPVIIACGTSQVSHSMRPASSGTCAVAASM